MVSHFRRISVKRLRLKSYFLLHLYYLSDANCLAWNCPIHPCSFSRLLCINRFIKQEVLHVSCSRICKSNIKHCLTPLYAPQTFVKIKYHVWNELPVQVRCTILDAWGWCTGMTQRDRMGWEEGGGFRMGNTCIPVADSFWYLAKLIQLCKV